MFVALRAVRIWQAVFLLREVTKKSHDSSQNACVVHRRLIFRGLKFRGSPFNHEIHENKAPLKLPAAIWYVVLSNIGNYVRNRKCFYSDVALNFVSNVFKLMWPDACYVMNRPASL